MLKHFRPPQRVPARLMIDSLLKGKENCDFARLPNDSSSLVVSLPRERKEKS